MPFIQSFSQKTKAIKSILFLSVDKQKIHAKTAEFARSQLQNLGNILWIDANLGGSEYDKMYIPLDKVLHDKGALPKAIRHSKQLSILSGRSSKPLSLCSEIQQKQFLLDLTTLSENYTQIIVSAETIQPNLQNLWLDWAQKKFLLFSCENLALEKTADFLKENAHKIDGLICLDSNENKAYLTWVRLQKIIPNIPKLILDITKTAQEL